MVCTLYLVLTAAIFLLVLMFKNKKTQCSVPSPFALPLVGHLPFVNLRAPFLTFTEWAKCCGPLFRVNMAGQELVIVNGYEAIKELLVKPDFNYRPDFFRINRFRQMGGYGFSEPDSCWKSLRKATFTGIRSYGPGLGRMNRILTEIGERTMAKIVRQEAGGQSFDPWDIVYSHMLSSITAFTLGEGVEPSQELHDIVSKLDALAMSVLSPAGVGASLDTAPWLRHLGHPVWKQLLQLISVRDELWELVNPSLKQDAASIGHCFLQAQAENPNIDTERVKCAVGDMMIAGSVTTTVSTYCLLQILAHHPVIQSKLHTEVDKVLGSSMRPCVEDLDDMPYMRAVLYELQRYISVTPLGLPHASQQESSLAGYTLPKGTNLLPNLWLLHHDPTFWTQPALFQPERYLTESGSVVPADHPNRRRTLAFGMGPRLCPGENFAYSRIFLLITSLLKQFSLSSDNVPFQPATFGLGLAIEPNRYQLKLLPRRSSGGRAINRYPGEQ